MPDSELRGITCHHLESPPSKRRKVAAEPSSSPTVGATIIESRNTATQELVVRGLNRSISPPLSRRRRSLSLQRTEDMGQQQQLQSQGQIPVQLSSKNEESQKRYPHLISSPFHLTRIKDLSPAQNVDTITLHDILGNPLIKECWNFNYLFDIDFVRQHFDTDVRDLIRLKVIHGFWKKDDERRIGLQKAADLCTNVELVSAYMPDPFGTHHSKMLILFRHDQFAQVVIHTANMIARDWGNMTQAVWRSPLLPLQANNQSDAGTHSVGSGERFKIDLLRYLNAYGKRLIELVKELTRYDFSAIRAAFIGSAPSRQKPGSALSKTHTSWGWLGLREILSEVPIDPLANKEKGMPRVVIQVSSIATLGPTPTWLSHFHSVLSSHAFSKPQDSPPHTKANLFDKRESKLRDAPDPKLSVIFPTAHEIRTSLDGYNSGFSIHIKLKSPAQQKQQQYLKPLMCHWKHQADAETGEEAQHKRAERGSAAPHIKTYIRFSDETQTRIDWAMVTSANLSKQAWGEVENKSGQVWIQSWECGVVVWPHLFSSTFPAPSSTLKETVELVPVFGKDTPTQYQLGTTERVRDVPQAAGDENENVASKGGEGEHKKVIVGFRMPYDLPLEPYKADSTPWCASAEHTEPDWKGQIWGG